MNKWCRVSRGRTDTTVHPGLWHRAPCRPGSPGGKKAVVPPPQRRAPCRSLHAKTLVGRGRRLWKARCHAGAHAAVGGKGQTKKHDTRARDPPPLCDPVRFRCRRLQRRAPQNAVSAAMQYPPLLKPKQDQPPPVGPTTWVECLLLAPNLGRTGNAIG